MIFSKEQHQTYKEMESVKISQHRRAKSTIPNRWQHNDQYNHNKENK